MKRATLTALVAIGTLLIAGCAQEDARFPDDTGFGGGECGAWYPGGGGADAGVDGGAEADYAVEEGAIFPCAVWESAMLDGQETFINVGQVHLEAKHGATEHKSIVVIVSAEECPACVELIGNMIERKDEFDAAGAFMIAMARRSLHGAADDPDFDLEKAYDVLQHEDWPVESWHVINDEEDYLPLAVDDGPPWKIIISVEDMVVQVMSNITFGTKESGVSEMLDYLNGPDFQ